MNHADPLMISKSRHEVVRLWERIVSVIILWIALLTYLLTAEPAASWWDCPEYITTATMLEPGHPPGNPVWMLTARMAVTLSCGYISEALAINRLSGLFSALTVWILYFLILDAIRYVSATRCRDTAYKVAIRITGAACGALCLAWSDTFWFSAVEAEVYAMSAFFTALSIWLAVKWSKDKGKPGANRWIVAAAYIMGLSIGVHQLNLLCIPAIGLIILFAGRRICRAWDVAGVLLISLGVICSVLYGMMVSWPKLAAYTELISVNLLHWFVGSGFVVWSCVTLLTIAGAAISISRHANRFVSGLLVASALFSTGLLIPGGNLALGIALCIAAGLAFAFWRKLDSGAGATIIWCAAMLFLGFSSYGALIIRGAANPPVNQGHPGDPFSFIAYLSREQYGSSPLLYGPTPQSTPLAQEEYDTEGNPHIGKKYKIKKSPLYAHNIPGAKSADRSGFLTLQERAACDSASESVSPRYVLTGYSYDFRYPSSLNMWLPRIHSSNPSHLEAYKSWIGMTPETMVSIQAAEAVDSSGNEVGLMQADGKRKMREAKRPSYLQNFEYMGAYQVYYMYLRYLMWNISGRQNGMASQGQAEHGNFITGFDPIDNLMLGDQNAPPKEIGKGARGRATLFLLPMLLALTGAILLPTTGRRGRRVDFIVLVLFVMTGLAIVVYLNQNPGEPRERDYSFVGSFMAVAIWIGLGAWKILSLCNGRKRLTWIFMAACMGVPALMLGMNFRNHDRSDTTATRNLALDLLESADENAIIFVNGDNYIFPLWYAQEVEGIRPDVKIVSIAYLSTPWYPRQLMIPGGGSLPLPLTATPADIGYGALQAIGFDSTEPTDAIGALRRLYGSNSGRIASSRLKVPAGTDSIIMDLSAGSGTILQHRLLIADAIATNAAQGWKRPIYWVNGANAADFVGLSAHTPRIGLLHKLMPSIPGDSITKLNETTLLAMRRTGGFPSSATDYSDDVTSDFIHRLRNAYLLTASQLQKQGENARALRLLETMESRFPWDATPPITRLRNGEIANEEVTAALLYHSISKGLNRRDLQNLAEERLTEAAKRGATFRSYRNILPTRLKNVLTPATITEATTMHLYLAAADTIGMGKSKLLSLPGMKNYNIDKEDELWRLRVLRVSLVPEARPYMRRRNGIDSQDQARDTLVIARLREYFKMGGRRSDLESFAEFQGFPFDSADIPQENTILISH